MWEYGIQKEKTEVVENEQLHEFKLAGTPWVGEGEESTMCRLLLLQVVGRLAKYVVRNFRQWPKTIRHSKLNWIDFRLIIW